jgi:hypothetical protein
MTLCVLLAGAVIALGAVTVIDLHGFLAQRSSYWTQTTIRTHKITKPLIWLGTVLWGLGLWGLYSLTGYANSAYIHLMLYLVLVANGCFLSFVISPYLLAREKKRQDTQLLGHDIQHKIRISVIVSFVCWWGSILLVTWYLTELIISLR